MVALNPRSPSLRRLASALAILSFAPGCGEERSTVTNISEERNVKPIGTIQGRVTDATTGAALAGVTVRTLASEGLSTTTDGDGFYVLKDVPAGEYILYYEAQGFVRSVAGVTLKDTAGDFPIGNALVTRNVVLAHGSGKVNGYVYATLGRPASGATVVADLRPMNFDLVVATKVNAEGFFSLEGLPGFAAGLPVTLAVAPYDENGDGTPDYSSRNFTVAVFPDTTSMAIAQLAGDGLSVQSSNLMDGELAKDEPIEVVFTSPLDLERTWVALRNLTDGTTVATTRSYDASRKVMTVRTAGDAPLTEGEYYRLDLNAVSASGDAISPQIEFQVRTAPVQPITSVVTNLKVEAPAAPESSTRNYRLGWDAVTDAASYRVYAHDSGSNPAWVYVGSYGTVPAPSVWVTLPTTFDTYSGDTDFFGAPYYTPLAFGTSVTFAVVPVDRYGYEAPLSGAATVAVSDINAPEVWNNSQDASFNNTGSATERTVRLSIWFDEYMSTSIQPTLSLPGSGAYTATWTWNRDTRSGYFTVSLTAGANRSGTATISNAQDTNGNVMVAETISNY